METVVELMTLRPFEINIGKLLKSRVIDKAVPDEVIIEIIVILMYRLAILKKAPRKKSIVIITFMFLKSR